jgi:hypothetical protein
MNSIDLLDILPILSPFFSRAGLAAAHCRGIRSLSRSRIAAMARRRRGANQLEKWS